MTTISMKDYQFKKMEHKYFEFYRHVEEFLGEKKTEQDLIKRLYFTDRYLRNLILIIKAYIKTGEATDNIKKIAKAGSIYLQVTAEELKDV